MLTSHATLKFLRKTHLYIGIFITPALLFFAFTGALQTFSLHETTQGSSYKPPAWLVTLGQLHKKQTTIISVRKQRPASPDKSASEAHKADATKIDGIKIDRVATLSTGDLAQAPKVSDTPSPSQKSHLPMKIFFLLVAIGLFISTLTGIYMSYKYNRSKLVVTGLLLAGIVIPMLLLSF